MFAACNLWVLLACLSTGPRLTIIVLTFSVLLQVVGGTIIFICFGHCCAQTKLPICLSLLHTFQHAGNLPQIPLNVAN